MEAGTKGDMARLVLRGRVGAGSCGTRCLVVFLKQRLNHTGRVLFV